MISNPDRVLYPRTGFTKHDLATYARAIAPAILPHLAGRAVTLARFPEGVEAEGWYQTNCPRGAPPFVRTTTFTSPAGKRLTMLLVEDVDTLVWTAQVGAIELHPFLARADAPDAPHAVVFDLDPGPPAGLADAARIALAVRARMAALGLAAYAKTSGATGVHVYVPVAGATYADTKAFARRIAAELVAEMPDRVVDRMKKSERAGKVLVDWSQNDAMKSTVAPYSLRAMPVPLASTPVRWEEVEEGRLRFTPAAVLERLERDGDLFAPVLGAPQRLPT